MAGLCYGWGSLIHSINLVFNPDDPEQFSNQHGTFTGVIILVVSTIPMVPLRLLIDGKFLTELQSQILGMILWVVGLFLGGLSLQFKLLSLLYIGCALPCGLGALCIFQRLVFNHQLWFKRISNPNLGAGLFGFFIGLADYSTIDTLYIFCWLISTIIIYRSLDSCFLLGLNSSLS